MITVQSYSKNMGLYAERAGVVSFTCVTLPGCPRRDLRLTTAQAHAPLEAPPLASAACMSAHVSLRPPHAHQPDPTRPDATPPLRRQLPGRGHR